MRSLVLVSVDPLALAFASILAEFRAFLRSICSFSCAGVRGVGVKGGMEDCGIVSVNGAGTVDSA